MQLPGMWAPFNLVGTLKSSKWILSVPHGCSPLRQQFTETKLELAVFHLNYEKQDGGKSKKKKKTENTQREKQAERYFRKCGGNYIYISQ